MPANERKLDFKILITEAPDGRAMGVNNENFEEKWPRYNGTTLYMNIYIYIYIFQYLMLSYLLCVNEAGIFLAN